MTNKTRKVVRDELPVLSCPFCSSIVLLRCGFHVTCMRCGAEGPDGDENTDVSAIVAWNRRATEDKRPAAPKG